MSNATPPSSPVSSTIPPPTMLPEQLPPRARAAALRWYMMAGVDCFLQATPQDAFAMSAAQLSARVSDGVSTQTPALRTPASSGTPSATLPPATHQALAEAERLAAAAHTPQEVRAALETYDGCPLKKTATRLVYGIGNPHADVLFIGEGPGAQEDREGIPFVGAAGQLLTKMLASVGINREDVFITNMVYWRPPGNRTPLENELALCRPFVTRTIELVAPRMVVMLGGVAAKSLLNTTTGIGRLRKQSHTLVHGGDAPIPAFAMYHPSYLLRSPQNKREAWQDVLMLKKRLSAQTLMPHNSAHDSN